MLRITPDVRVAALLDAYPELEAVLLAQAPAFRALRNPVLRRTVARVATLEQAAGIGHLPVRSLIRALRSAVGQPVDDMSDGGDAAADGPHGHACAHDRTRPDTTLPPVSAETTVLDADALLESGVVPLGPIVDAATALDATGELRVLVAFRPVPIVERLERLGFACDYGLHDADRAALRVRRMAAR